MTSTGGAGSTNEPPTELVEPGGTAPLGDGADAFGQRACPLFAKQLFAVVYTNCIIAINGVSWWRGCALAWEVVDRLQCSHWLRHHAVTTPLTCSALFALHTTSDALDYQQELARLTGLSPRPAAGDPFVRTAQTATAAGSRGGGGGGGGGSAAATESAARREARAAAREQRMKEEDAKELALEMKYTADHVVALVIPVSVTMAAVVATVKSISYYSKQGQNLA